MIEIILVIGLFTILWQLIVAYWYIFVGIFILIIFAILLKRRSSTKLKKQEQHEIERLNHILQESRLKRRKNLDTCKSYLQESQMSIQEARQQYERQNQMHEVELSRMRGVQFEQYCMELLKINGFQNVSGTKGSGDQGVDIIAFRDGLKYAIQCKGYEKDVGNAAIKDAIAGKAYTHADVAVAMINTFFTPAAIDLAREANVRLWDKNVLLEMMQKSKEVETDVPSSYQDKLNTFLKLHTSSHVYMNPYKTLKGEAIYLQKYTTTTPYNIEAADKVFFGRAHEIADKMGKHVFYCLKHFDNENIDKFHAAYDLIAIPNEEVDNIIDQFADDYYIGIAYHT